MLARILSLVVIVAMLLPLGGSAEVAASATGDAPGPLAAPHQALPPASASRISDLPAPAQALVSQTLGRDDAVYHIAPVDGGYRADNPEHHLAAGFTPDAVQIQTGNGAFTMKFAGYGYGQSVTPDYATPSGPVAQDNRIEYQRSPEVTEWYINGPMGLEQGFTLTAPPPGGEETGGSPLRIDLRLAGELTPRLDTNGQSLALWGADGAMALRYGGLRSYDATGRDLRTWLEVAGDTVQIRVDAAGAVYPIVVDPYIQQARLVASDGAANDYFGLGVAVSVDGNTLLISSRDADRFYQGAVYVLIRSGGNWSQQAKLTASDRAPGDYFGTSLALSGDGNTAIIGAPYKTGGCNPNYCYTKAGAAYVFVRSGSSWTQQTILGTQNPEIDTYFGRSVALSGDGNTAFVGVPGVFQAPQRGAVYVFKRGGTWSQAGILYPPYPSEAYSYSFGASVALSNDGGTGLVVGSPIGSAQGGVIFIYGSGGSYGLQAKLIPSDPLNCSSSAAALSGDGNTAAISGSQICVFTRSSGSWTQQVKLTASDLGGSIALSNDGTTALAGSGNTSLQGAAYLFTRSGSTWSQQQKLSASDGAGDDYFGRSVVLSGDGRTAIVGSPGKLIGSNTNQGAVYVFATVVVPASVAITGPSNGLIGASLGYTATVSPVSATLPITYSWQATGQTSVTYTNISDITSTASFAWTTGGSKTITVTADNGYGIAFSSVTTNVVVPISSLAIAPPVSCAIGNPCGFTATASPSTATTPITYTWAATDQASAVHPGAGISDIASFLWSSSSAKTITVTADNGYSSATTNVTVNPSIPIASAVIISPSFCLTGTPCVMYATVSPANATLPITYTWTASDQAPISHHGVNSISDTVSFAWTTGGSKTVTVTADNGYGTAASSITTNVVVPISSLIIVPPVACSTGASCAFTATASPSTATTPITYTWSATSQTGIVHSTSSVSDTVSFNWPSGGAKTITVTADNAYSSATATISANVVTPILSLSITPPVPCVTGSSCAFTATASPSTATTPITYTWAATDQTGAVHTGGGVSDTANFVWSSPGVKTIRVTANNGYSSATAGVTINPDTPIAVTITPPFPCVTGAVCVFSATVSPSSAALPISYAWAATDQVAISHNSVNSTTDTVSYSWVTGGVKTVTLTATNAAGSVVRAASVIVGPQRNFHPTPPAPPSTPALSALTVSPSSVLADGSAAATITVTLRDASGNPAAGKRVLLGTSRGPLDRITSATGVTDSNGVFTTTVRSRSPGFSAIKAYVAVDRVYLPDASVTFR